MTIGPAEKGDLPAVRQLLEAQHLPLDGVDAQLPTMVVAKDGSGVVGAAAVELYADGALLRSVVVSPLVQGQGLGRRLTEAALDIAKSHGIATAFLLTTTAETLLSTAWIRTDLTGGRSRSSPGVCRIPIGVPGVCDRYAKAPRLIP